MKGSWFHLESVCLENLPGVEGSPLLLVLVFALRLDLCCFTTGSLNLL